LDAGQLGANDSGSEIRFWLGFLSCVDFARVVVHILDIAGRIFDHFNSQARFKQTIVYPLLRRIVNWLEIKLISYVIFNISRFDRIISFFAQ
ncbi:unnamed protein product, partial [Mycena citricolor]